jgi:hypothetical protein
MKIPGFSAEASLYETRDSYRVVGVGPSPSAQVLPAAFDTSHCDQYGKLCFFQGWASSCQLYAMCLAAGPKQNP